MAGGAFQIRSKKWDVGILIGALIVLLIGFGGLFLLQQIDAAGTPTLLFVVLLGVITFGFFAGPGIVYVMRKRIAWVKQKLPGGTMTWIRSHLYLPILALLAGLIHASTVPFRGALTSGKVLLVLGILVSIAGVCRHHLIGVQKAALNVNVAISKISTGQPRAFRRLVADYTDTKRPVSEIDAEMAQFPPDLQERWAKIKSLRSEVDKHFPREGGQRLSVRSYKLWRALHPPLTIILFVVLAFHMWDVLGATNHFFGDKKQQFVAAESCAGCHSREYQEWAGSPMTHAQTSTITVAQLPVTLAQNRELADNAVADNNGQVPANNTNPDVVVDQNKLVSDSAKVCTTCHAPVGASFAPNADALFPFDNQGSAGVKAKGAAVDGGGPVVQSDGVGCQVCHGTSKPPTELQAATGPLNDQQRSLGGFGEVFGPLFENPNPLPQRIHDIGNGDGNWWNDPIQQSQLCAACHDVKLDLRGDGLAKDPSADPNNPTADTPPNTTFDGLDTSATPVTNLDEAQKRDRNNNLELDENEADNFHDVVLQTTYDEWQDYVAFFDAGPTGNSGDPNATGFKDRYSKDKLGELGYGPDHPLGCSDCHMPLPSKADPNAAVVDHNVGLLPTPTREYHEHTFIGVDYDLDPGKYDLPGTPSNAETKELAQREALVRSAVTLKVTPDQATDTNGKGLTDANGKPEFLFDPALAPLATQKDADGNEVKGKLVTFNVQVRNNMLAHTFPTGFAFARQFWLAVSATTKDGTPVCLSAPPFVVGQAIPIASPCTSGVLGVDTSTSAQDAVDKAKAGPSPQDVDTDLRQCDAKDVGTKLGLDVTSLAKLSHDGGDPLDKTSGIRLQNTDIAFARTSPSDNCDPWLTNFQKILTDGDPQNSGTFTEVAYQSFVPNLVHIRGRIATGQNVADLQPVRLDKNGNPQDTGVFPYTFFVPDDLNITSPDDLVVTAKMEVRHLPPYFVADLAQDQQDLLDKGFNVPEDARIFDDGQHPDRLENLLGNMTITEAGSATSDGNETLGCNQGPQNVDGGTINDCVKDDKTQHTVFGPGFGKVKQQALPSGHPTLPSETKTLGLGAGSTQSGLLTVWSAVLLVLVTPVAAWRRRRRRLRVS